MLCDDDWIGDWCNVMLIFCSIIFRNKNIKKDIGVDFQLKGDASDPVTNTLKLVIIATVGI